MVQQRTVPHSGSPATASKGSGRRVIVTGMGCVCALGTTLRETIEQLEQGRSGLTPFSKFPLPGGVLGQVEPYDTRAWFPKSKNHKLASRHTCLSVTAAAGALKFLASGSRGLDPARTGVIAGHGAIDNLPDQLGLALGSGYQATEDSNLLRFSGAICGRLHPLWLLTTLPNMVSSQLAIQFDLRGPNSTLLTEWTAGLQALGEAFLLVSQGEARAMLAGASESGTVETLGVTSRHLEALCEADFRWGEGAAYWLLETLPEGESEEDGYWGEIVSYYSWSAEPADFKALRQGIERVLQIAGVEPAAVDRICPAGLRLQGRREGENRILDEVFGAGTHRLQHQDSLGFLGTAHPVLEATLALATGTPEERTLVLAEGVEGHHSALLLRIGGGHVRK